MVGVTHLMVTKLAPPAVIAKALVGRPYIQIIIVLLKREKIQRSKWSIIISDTTDDLENWNKRKPQE